MLQNPSDSPIGNAMSRSFDRNRDEGSASRNDQVASPSRTAYRGRPTFVQRTTVLACFSFLAAAFLTTGCSTTDAAASRKSASSPTVETSPDYQRLIKGMRRAEVANYLGKPEKVEPFTTEGAAGEIWRYSRIFPGPTRQVSTEMRDIETVDPISGVMTMRKEPVYRNEMTTITEIAELLFIKDLLVEWKQQRFSDRQLH